MRICHNFKPNKVYLLALFLFLTLSPISLVFASSYIPSAPKDALAESDLVVIARCVGSEAVFKDGQIFTLQTFEVQNYIKGYQGNYITISQPGGSLGNVEMIVPGSTYFLEGEESVLFLNEQPDGNTTPAFPGSSLPIYRDHNTGQRYVINAKNGGATQIQELDDFVRDSIQRIKSFEFNEGKIFQIKEMGRLEYNEEITISDEK